MRHNQAPDKLWDKLHKENHTKPIQAIENHTKLNQTKSNPYQTIVIYTNQSKLYQTIGLDEG